MAEIGIDSSRPVFADVSQRHPVVDWDGYASGAAAAGALGFRVDEGHAEDPTFRAHLAGAEVQGLVALGFAWGPAGVDEFLESFAPKPGRVPVLDFEASGLSVSAAEGWITRIQAEWGRAPFFYGHRHWLAAGQPKDTSIAECPYWGPQYGSALEVPDGVGEVVAHRFTDGAFGPEPHIAAGVLNPCGVSSLLVPARHLRFLAGLEAARTTS
jgi:lysozyme